MVKRKKIGQSTAEYAIVIGLVIAAAVAMQIYVKRGIQGKIKGTVDYVPPEGAAIFTGAQYEPDYAKSLLTSSRTARESTQTNKGGEVIRNLDNPEVSQTSGTREVVALP